MRAPAQLVFLCLVALLGACSSSEERAPGENVEDAGGLMDQGEDAPELAVDLAEELDAAPEVSPDLSPEVSLEEEPELAPECAPDEQECRGAALYTCEAGRWVEGACPPGSMCRGRACVARVCEPNAARCGDDEALYICNRQGTQEEVYPCAEGSVCEGERCVALCAPGARDCEGPRVRECQPDGRSWAALEVCDAAQGRVCQNGVCNSSCEALREGKEGYIGCDYWGVDTPNQFGIPNVFAFVISNTSAQTPALIQVEVAGELVLEETVAPLEVAALRLPSRAFNVARAGVWDRGYRLTTNVPINAYQFNPLQRIDTELGISVASNDASLMLPDAALGTRYIGVSYPQWDRFPGFLSIVSTEDNNLVRVTPTANVAAGPGLAAMTAGQEAQVRLGRGQVLNLNTQAAGDDLTGTLIEAEERVAVYGGVDCARVPVGMEYCDHIEEMLFPVRAWGSEYLGAKFQVRGQEPDYWRVVASEPDTVVTLDPPLVQVPALGQGEHFTFSTPQDFALSASAPVLLVQYMTSSEATVTTEQGDPSMLLAAPTRQFRRDYVFLVPDTYDLDWVTVVAPQGVAVVLDGEPLDLSTAPRIGQSRYVAARVPVADGRHEIRADEPVGVSVYGYDRNISYAYPAGLDLSAIDAE